MPEAIGLERLDKTLSESEEIADFLLLRIVLIAYSIADASASKIVQLLLIFSIYSSPDSGENTA